MASDTLNTTLHTTLESLSKTPAGFSASEVTGYSPEQVRRAAQALVGAGRLHRANVSPRRVRYFADELLARNYTAKRPSGAPQRMVAGARTKATWSPDEPGLITPQTKIIRAPTPQRSVFRTNIYLQF
jgi:hypothetical protein